MVRVEAAMTRFSGVVQADTLIAGTVVTSGAAPGPGTPR